MSTLTQEATRVQNPALGAVMLWRYVLGWTDHNKIAAHPPLPLLFIVLPILFHQETLEVVKGTNKTSGLTTFAEKFSRSTTRKSDVLMSIHSRAMSWRDLTWESLQFAVRARLLTVSKSSGTAIPLSSAKPRNVAPSVSRLLTSAEKLGYWCANLTTFEIAAILKVQF